MEDQSRPIYLERDSYRRRRLADGARLAPVFGAVLLLMPALWGSETRTGTAMIYVFSVWALLIVVMAIVSRRLSDDEVPSAKDADPSAEP